MTLNTYLFFDGDCADAFDFYKSVFGGDFAMRQTYGEGPSGPGVTAAEKNRIMHVALPLGSSVLMGSDTTDKRDEPYKKGNDFAISYSPASKAEADAKFAALSKGGAVTLPMQDMFWGAYFGMCKDRFGVRWMVNHQG